MQTLENERILVQWLLLSEGKEIENLKSRPEDFQDGFLKAVFKAILELVKEGVKPSLDLIFDKLQGYSGAGEKLGKLLEGAIREPNWKIHDLKIKQRSLLEKIKTNAQKGEIEELETTLSELKSLNSDEEKEEPFTNVAQLMREDIKVSWIVESLIPQNSITLFFGKGKLGKTTLILQMLGSIAKNERFMGLETHQVPIYYINFENPRGVLKQRIEKLGLPENINLWLNPPPINSKDFKEKFQMIPEGSLVVIDSLSSALYKLDLKEAVDLNPVLKWAIEQRDTRGITFIFIHHTSKGNDLNPLGTVSLINLSDQILILYPVKEEGTFEEYEGWLELGNIPFYFGTQGGRYYEFHIFIKRSHEQKWIVAKSPVEEKTEHLKELIESFTRGNILPTQKDILQVAKEELGWGKMKIMRILKEGEGKFWNCKRGEHGKKIYTLIQTQNSSFPPIYNTGNLENWKGDNPEFQFSNPENNENEAQTKTQSQNSSFLPCKWKTEIPEFTTLTVKAPKNGKKLFRAKKDVEVPSIGYKFQKGMIYDLSGLSLKHLEILTEANIIEALNEPEEDINEGH